MAALLDLMTVEQFRQLPDDGRAYELHHGELVLVSHPKAKHYHMQWRLVHLLEAQLSGFGHVGMEFPYRPIPEFDFRVADVAAVSQGRYDAIDPDDNLRGAPELVIEIKSPSNTNRKLRELASLVLANGGLECWIVDLDARSVTVMNRNGSSSVFRSSGSIPLTAFGAEALPVAQMFT